MKRRRAKRWPMLVVMLGLVAAAGVPVASEHLSIGDLMLAGSGSEATPVGADKKPAGRPTAVKPGTGRNTPVPAEPVPTEGDGGVFHKGPAAQQSIVLIREVVTAEDVLMQAAAECPAGLRVYGGGVRVIDGQGQIVVQELRPETNQRTQRDKFVAVISHRAEGSQPPERDKTAEVSAICGPPLPGYVRVVAGFERVVDSRNATDQRITTQVACPVGTKVIGASGSAVGRAGRLALERVAPDAAGSSVTVSGVDDISSGTESGVARVQAIAICAQPLPGYEIVTQQTPFDKGSHVAKAVCPTGKKAYGTGFAKEDEAGHAVVEQVAAVPAGRSNPDPRIVQVTAQQSPLIVPARLTAFAICAE